MFWVAQSTVPFADSCFFSFIQSDSRYNDMVSITASPCAHILSYSSTCFRIDVHSTWNTWIRENSCHGDLIRVVQVNMFHSSGNSLKMIRFSTLTRPVFGLFRWTGVFQKFSREKALNETSVLDLDLDINWNRRTGVSSERVPFQSILINRPPKG